MLQNRDKDGAVCGIKCWTWSPACAPCWRSCRRTSASSRHQTRISFPSGRPEIFIRLNKNTKKEFMETGMPYIFWDCLLLVSGSDFQRIPAVWSLSTAGNPETEFLNSIFVEVSRDKLESSQTRVFYPHLSVLHNAIHALTRVFSCFADFLYGVLKPE